MACEDLVFAVNGERFEVFSVHPSTTLLEFLRSSTPFKSLKLSCGEGIFFVLLFGLYHVLLLCLNLKFISRSFL